MESAGDWVQVEFDDDGRVVDVWLDPRVMSLSVESMRSLLVSALQGCSVASPYAVAPPDRLRAVSAEATELAERRFAEISAALFDLSRRAVPRW